MALYPFSLYTVVNVANIGGLDDNIARDRRVQYEGQLAHERQAGHQDNQGRTDQVPHQDNQRPRNH